MPRISAVVSINSLRHKPKIPPFPKHWRRPFDRIASDWTSTVA